jgi:nucleoside-diphosphate-sugar epimerase
MVCLNHPAAANQIFLASDGDDLSTVALLQRMANALGVKARLFNVSPILLKFGAKLLGKESVYLRLCESLQIDMTKTRQLLNWNPPLSVDIGLQLAAKGNI